MAKLACWSEDQKPQGFLIENGLPAEMAFMKMAGAFATDTPEELTLTPRGRYLVVAMMRQFFIGVNSLREDQKPLGFLIC